MKKGVVIIIIMAILAGYSYALTVTLTEPTNSQTLSGNSVTFKCKADEAVTSLKLYHNINGWQENQTNSSAVSINTDYSFTTISNIAAGSYNWNCLASNETSGFFASSNYSFTISSNKAPFYTTIPNMKWSEDTVNNSLDLDNYFTDPDGNSLSYYISDNSLAKFDIDNSTGIVTIKPKANYSGSFTAAFTASDASLTNTSNNILFNITQVNDIPYLIKPIPNQTWKTTNELKIDLSDYFDDVDSNLTYSATNLTNIDINFNNQEERVVLKAKNNWTGTSKIIFKANDSFIVLSSNEVTLKVVVENTAPEIRSYFPLEDPRVNTSNPFNFSIQGYDANGDLIRIQWYLNDAAITGATTSSYVFTPATKGVYKLKAIISDGVFTDSQEWAVFVSSINEQSSGINATAGNNLCGNNLVDAGEGCQTCQIDVKCADDEKCVENKCILEEKSNRTLVLIIILGVALISIAVSLFLYYRHKKGYQFVEETPIKEENVEKKETKISPAVEIDDIYPDKRKGMKERKTVSSVILKDYVKTCLNKGISPEKIKKNLLEKGWKKEQVEAALLEFELKRK